MRKKVKLKESHNTSTMSEHIDIRMTASLYNKINEIAESKGMKASALARFWVMKAVELEEKKKA